VGVAARDNAGAAVKSHGWDSATSSAQNPSHTYTTAGTYTAKLAETTTTTKYDTLKVQILNSSGTVLSTLHTYSNLDHITGYTQHSFPLSAYAGQTITLKFTGHEDYEKQTSFVIDDTAINVS
jgi:PKD repeat protein